MDIVDWSKALPLTCKTALIAFLGLTITSQGRDVTAVVNWCKAPVKTLASLFKGENGLFGLILAEPLAVSLSHMLRHTCTVYTRSAEQWAQRHQLIRENVSGRWHLLRLSSGWMMHETTTIEPFIWFSCSGHAWLHTTHEQTPCWQTSMIYGFDS